MQLEATGQPIRYRLKTGEEFTLRPGVPMELPDRAATQLLQKAPDKVRRVDPISSLQPGELIAWESKGVPRGPATIDFLHPDGIAWACVTLPDGTWSWVNLKYATAEGGQ